MHRLHESNGYELYKQDFQLYSFICLVNGKGMNTENSYLTKWLFAIYVSKHKLQRILFTKNQTSVVNSSLMWIEKYFTLLVKAKIKQIKNIQRKAKTRMVSTEDMGKLGEYKIEALHCEECNRILLFKI